MGSLADVVVRADVEVMQLRAADEVAAIRGAWARGGGYRPERLRGPLAHDLIPVSRPASAPAVSGGPTRRPAVLAARSRIVSTASYRGS